jgi:hypothetical protein
MDPPVQVGKPRLQAFSKFFPRHPVHSRCSPLFQAAVTISQQIDGHVV